MIRIAPALLLIVLAARAESVERLLEQKLMERIQEIDRKLDGVLGVAAIDLTNGHILQYHGDAVFPQASSIKIPIMIEMFHAAAEGKWKMSDPITLEPQDKVGGSGHLGERLDKGPVTLTIRELVTAMMETSDNTATNRCIAMLGIERINRRIQLLGLTQTRLQRIMMDGTAARTNRENISTPLEMSRLAELIYRGKAAGPDQTKEMVGILKLVKADFRRSVPAAVEVASKPGSIPGVHCETGIIYLEGRPFALSVMSTFLGERVNPVGEVARAVFDHFQRLAVSNQYGHKVK